VSYAIKSIKQLKKVIILGTTSPIPAFPPNYPIAIYPYSHVNEYTLTSILNQLPTKSTYVSIDKDVLQQSDAYTNWDHGKMRLSTLLFYLQKIFQLTRVEGVDICGEAPLSPNYSI